MFSLCDLLFVLCSLDLDALRAHMTLSFFNLSYPQTNEVEKSDYMDKSSALFLLLFHLEKSTL